jgi:arylsulfatase A-like enzyme
MKTVLLLLDTLIKDYLPNYGDEITHAPNFLRLGEKTTTFDNFYACSMPCMPARREMHTGRPNFLHRSWSPLEPFDESVIRNIKKLGVYTHMVTDHFHYLEIGGYGYLNEYDSFEIIRGQQGDLWKPFVGELNYPENLSRRAHTNNFDHDWINRQHMQKEEDLPAYRTFAKGIDFIERFHNQENWFLTIESFSPHEPFYTVDKYLNLFEDNYDGPTFDWPDYGEDTYPEAAKEHVQLRYRAMVSMIDAYLGKVLDTFDRLNLWEDTALIVYTDHGFLLGEHGFMGKNFTEPYEAITHTPFFIHDPRNPKPGTREKRLACSLNLAPTLAELFNLPAPESSVDLPLSTLADGHAALHDAVFFGCFGGQIGISDGHYALYKSPLKEAKGELYNYTLAPSHMRVTFGQDELSQTELVTHKDVFGGDLDTKILKVPASESDHWFRMPDKLYDIKADPKQNGTVDNPVKQKELEGKLRSLFVRYHAPREFYKRFGLEG